jgi:hypothetical protein
MDANRFDQFTRSLGQQLSRRRFPILGAAVTLLWPGMADNRLMDHAEAKKGKKNKKKCKKPRVKCKKKCCRPGQVCSGGKCKAGGPCSVSSNSVSLVTETKFNKKPLRLRQSSDVANGDRQFEVTLDGKAVLKVTHEVAEPGVVTTVTYGGAFRGIDQARFATDGATITGEIDGRAIVPLPVGADPSQMAFADGGPPLDIQGDADLVEAIQGLFAKASEQANSCKPAQKRSVSTKDFSSFECILEQVKCAVEMGKCEWEAVETAAACSFVPFFGPLVCGIVLTVDCAHDGAKCVRAAKFGPVCCPVRCGGDVGDIFGRDPHCCEAGWSCVDPNSHQSDCCAPGMVSCGGECCPAGSCTSGFCCEPPNGSICGNQCCGPFDSCCGGQCCSGICNGIRCCIGNELPCGTTCCDGPCCNGNCCRSNEICCNGMCCPSGYDCQNNQCVQVCAPGELPCHGQCCTGGRQCYRCPNGVHVCRFGPCIN